MKKIIDKIKDFCKKHQKAIVSSLISIAVLAAMALTSVLTVSAAMVSRTEDLIVDLEAGKKLQGIEAIIVLGCKVRGETPSDMLRDRLDVAIELYHAGVGTAIIMSGDHGGTEYNEVAVMKKYAVDKGVPEDRIFMDHAGFSTYETMYRARDVFLHEAYFKRVVIVTQKYHLHRALYVAESLGLDATGVSADLHTYGGQAGRDLREALARTKDFFFALYDVKPTYLGDPISIYEDGNLTNDQAYKDLVAKDTSADSPTK